MTEKLENSLTQKKEDNILAHKTEWLTFNFIGPVFERICYVVILGTKKFLPVIETYSFQMENQVSFCNSRTVFARIFSLEN